MPKRSENAKAVARDVKDALKKGKRVLLGDIVEKRGYGKSAKKNPQRVRSTKSYKEEMFDFLQWTEKEEKRICKALSIKNLSKVQYEGLVRSLSEVKKQQALAGGKPTDLVQHTVSFKKL